MGVTRVPDLDSLSLLLEIAVAGSLGRAAVAHGISQPAVSARVRSMEALIGVPLLDRTPRGSSLTPAGVLVAGWARDVLSAAELFDVGIASLRASSEQHLRIASSMTVAEHLLPRWLVWLAADRPDTAVSLEAMNSSQVHEAVLQRHADIGFVEGPAVAAELDSHVVARDRLVVIVAPGHPWTRRRRVDATELATTRLVQREPSSGTRTALESALASQPSMAMPLLELSTTSAVRAAVAAGAGPAVLSRLAVDQDLTDGRLVEIATSGVDLDRDLQAVWPRGQRLSRPAQDLLHIATTRHLRLDPEPAAGNRLSRRRRV